MACTVFKMRRWMSTAVGSKALAAAALGLAALAAGCGPSEPPIGANPKAYESAAPSGPLAFIGRWAGGPGRCSRDVWVIGSDGLRSPSALACSFESIEPTSAGYIVGGLCQVGKAVQPTRLVFTISGPPGSQSLTVTGGPFNEPIALSRCPAQDPAGVAALPPSDLPASSPASATPAAP